jgi:predicted enzyme related to lactoylglutathione lyase
MEIKNFRHIGIVTNNLSQSINFYKKVFGLKIFSNRIENDKSLAKIMGLEQVKIKTVKLKNDKIIILELLKWYYPKSNKNLIKKINSVGITHFAVTVKDINNVINKIKKFKNCYISEPEKSVDKKVKYAFCKTPEKIFIEIVEILKK